jgi:hypothetical protein
VAPTDAGRSGRRACLRTSEHHRRLVFDFKHGQAGVAPNAIEFQPILKFSCLSR